MDLDLGMRSGFKLSLGRGWNPIVGFSSGRVQGSVGRNESSWSGSLTGGDIVFNNDVFCFLNIKE